MKSRQSRLLAVLAIGLLVSACSTDLDVNRPEAEEKGGRPACFHPSHLMDIWDFSQNEEVDWEVFSFQLSLILEDTYTYTLDSWGPVENELVVEYVPQDGIAIVPTTVNITIKVPDGACDHPYMIYNCLPDGLYLPGTLTVTHRYPPWLPDTEDPLLYFSFFETPEKPTPIGFDDVNWDVEIFEGDQGVKMVRFDFPHFSHWELTDGKDK